MVKKTGSSRSSSGSIIGWSPDKLHIQDDELMRTVPWRLRDYKERGALSDRQKQELGARFDLSAELVDELSLLVGNSLDVDSIVCFMPVSRNKAVARAGKRLGRAASLASRIRHDHAALIDALAPLRTDFDNSGLAEGLLQELRDDLAGIAALVAGLEIRIDQIMAIPNGAAEIAPDDRRRVPDRRRTNVVRSCCYIWADSGRPVSYTTRPDRVRAPQRTGMLIDLVNAVVSMVTDPPATLSVETLRHEIDDFKRLRKAGRI